MLFPSLCLILHAIFIVNGASTSRSIEPENTASDEVLQYMQGIIGSDSSSEESIYQLERASMDDDTIEVTVHVSPNLMGAEQQRRIACASRADATSSLNPISLQKARILRGLREESIAQEEVQGRAFLPQSREDVQPLSHGNVKILPSAVARDFDKITRYAQLHSGARDALFKTNFYCRLLHEEPNAQRLVLAYYRMREGDREGELRLLGM